MKILEIEEINEILTSDEIKCFYNWIYTNYTNKMTETIMTLITECGVSQKRSIK